MSFTVIEYASMRFLIMDAPTDKNAHIYLEELKKQNVVQIVRVCDPSYNTDLFTKNGIQVATIPFADGEAPPSDVVTQWLDLVEKIFNPKNPPPPTGPQTTIAVHCVAGLGRAPVLVAIGLVERGMEPLDAVAYIRDKRKGSINQKQLHFLEKYKRRNAKCVIS